MLKKTLNQADLARHVLERFAKDPEVQGGRATDTLVVMIEMLAEPRNGANWQCAYGKPITFDEAARRAIAEVQAEYDLERPFPGGTAARL
jgi:hypothetical protein